MSAIRRLSIVLVLGLGASATSHAIPPFTYETIDASGIPGAYVSMAVDAGGDVHVAYRDDAPGSLELEYAVRRDGEWLVEVADGVGNVGEHASLALDADGRPHIAYYDNSGDDLEYAVKVDGVWVRETVDSAGDVGRWASLALDTQDSPHIAYYDVGNTRLRYAFKSNGVWNTETVVFAGNPGQRCALAVDALGNAHVAYWQVNDDFVWYTARVAGSWVEYVAPIGSAPDGNVNLELSPEGIPRVTFMASGGNTARYYEFAGLLWSPSTWTSGSSFTPNTSLALDGAGNPHIAAARSNIPGDLNIIYATRVDGVWEDDPIIYPGNTGAYTAIAIDPEGNPLIAFTDESAGALRLADSSVRLTSPARGETWTRGGTATVRWNGIGLVDILASSDGGLTYTSLASGVSGGRHVVDVPDWTTDRARVRIVRAEPRSTSTSAAFSIESARVSPWWTSSAVLGTHPSIAIGADATPVLAFRGGGATGLQVGTKDGTGWTLEPADASAGAGQYASIALDAEGRIHVGYYDGNPDDVKYAVRDELGWSTEVVDAAGNVGWYTSLALDRDGRPHLAYRDVTNGDLKYATDDGTGWMAEIVDAPNSVGGYVSLALTSEGEPRIAYHDFTGADLRYALQVDGDWFIEIVDVVGQVGLQASLAIDRDDVAHVSHISALDDVLKYSTNAGTSWTTSSVDIAVDELQATSVAIDDAGRPHILYRDLAARLRHAALAPDGTWTLQTLDSEGDIGADAALAFDASGNLHAVYRENTTSEIRYGSGGISVRTPSGGDTWPVGGTRSVTWDGAGAVDVALSVDGGSTFSTLANAVEGGAYALTVPHTPSRFCMVRIERREEANDVGASVYRYARAVTPRYFSIETSIELLAMRAAPLASGAGTEITWRTDPGPADLTSYRLERRRGIHSTTLVAETRETRHVDTDGRVGDTYRLYALNGLGEELYVGETRVPGPSGPIAGLSVRPVPLRGGSLTVAFAAMLAGGAFPVEVAVYDVSGRELRSLARGTFDTPVHTVTWDGRDSTGRPVGNGVYFVSVRSPLGTTARKVIVSR